MRTIKKLVIFAATFCTISLHAMKRPRQPVLKETTSSKKQALQMAFYNKNPSLHPFFFVIQQKILPFSTIIHAAQKFQNAALIFKNISGINKTLNAHLNKRAIMLDIIKQLSTTFNYSNQCVARCLSIKTAHDIHDAQELLYAYMCGAQENPQYVIQPLNLLIQQIGVDVNFTYRRSQQTALAVILKETYKDEVKEKIVDWLLEHGAIIAPITKDKDSAASIALYRNDVEACQKFCFHKNFNPNYAGRNGNTLLHNCLLMLQQKQQALTYNSTFLRTVKKIMPIIQDLLNKQIDVSAVNNAGRTALAIAHTIRHQPLITLLKKHQPTA